MSDLTHTFPRQADLTVTHGRVNGRPGTHPDGTADSPAHHGGPGRRPKPGLLLRLGLAYLDRTGRLTSGTSRRLLAYEHVRIGLAHPPDQSTHGEMTVRKLAGSNAEQVMLDSAAGIDRICRAIEKLRARGKASSDAADELMRRPVVADGLLRPLAATLGSLTALQDQLCSARDAGDSRHLEAPRGLTLSARCMPLLDFPVLLWFLSSALNVPWQRNPLGAPLAVALVLALIATAGSAVILHMLGASVREYKQRQYELDWSQMPGAARCRLLFVGLVVGLLALVMAVRIFTDATEAGVSPGIAALLATLLGVIVLGTSTLVWYAGVADGSPLSHRARSVADAVRPLLDRHQDLVAAAARDADQIALLQQAAGRTHSRAVTEASRRLNQADVMIALHHALTGAAGATACPTHDVNESDGVLGYQQLARRIPTDVRPSTVTNEHVQHTPLPANQGRHWVGAVEQDLPSGSGQTSDGGRHDDETLR